MKFQPGQSGNPAGRPPGARNKATIAREEELAERASKAVADIIDWAQRGNAVAMRICAEWARPSGTNRSPAIELPPITCSEDAQAALQAVLAAFGSGALTSRELPVVLERAVRIADRIQQMRERERERRQIRGETHPSMLPRPVALDPLVMEMRAAGEEVPDYLAAAHDLAVAALYTPVNSGGEDTDPFPEASPAAVAEPSTAEGNGLYSPVNSNDETPSVAAPEVSPVPPATADGLYSPVNSDAETPSAAGEEEAPAEPAAADGLYFPVNWSVAPRAGDVERVAAAARA